MTDWKTLTAARGLQLSDAELQKLGGVLEALDTAYESIAAKLTIDVEPATTLGDETVESR